MRFIKHLSEAMKEGRPWDFASILDTRILPEDLKWVEYNFLLKALQTGRIELALLLLDRGCHVHSLKDANSPLHLALLQKSPRKNELVIKLLQRGASVRARNANGETPLHLAFLEPDCQHLLDILLGQSCRQDSSNVANSLGLSFLHIACTRAKLDVVKFLLAGSRGGSRVDVNLQVSNHSLEFAGYTPLHFAVQSGNLQVADLLLRHGADLYRRDTCGSTPIHLACELRNVRMIDLLFTYDREFQDCANEFGLTHFLAACMGYNPAIVENFLYTSEHDDNFYSLNSELANIQVNKSVDQPFAGYTPLHFAAEFGRTETAKILLEAGANINVANARNVRPVRLAVAKKNFRTADAIADRLTTTSKSQKRNSSFFGVQKIDPIDELCMQTKTRMRLTA